MKKLITILLMAILIYSPAIAKDSKTKNITNEFKFNKELKGFEVDYLTNSEFKTKVEKKQIWGLIEMVINFIASWFSTSYGKYTEDTKNETGPYFIFDRGLNAKSLNDQLIELRYNINHNINNYSFVYKEVLRESVKPTITYKDLSSDNDKKVVCSGASAAKNAAFVYLVGLKEDGTGFSDMDMADRIVYRDRALNYLKVVEGYQLDDGFDKAMDIARFIGTPLAENGVAILWNWGDTREFIQYRTKELLMLVQTIDILEWAFKIDSDLTPINVQDIENCKAQIKKKYAIPMHRRCQIPFTGLYSSHNNFALLPAAAMGAASIALKNSGDEFTYTYKHPDRWANSALYSIHNVMWSDGLTDNAMSQAGKISGYAEGPHYFRYAFENMIPYFKARYNLRPEKFSHDYYSSLINPFSKHVSNQFFDNDYDNIYKWANNMTLPNGMALLSVV